MSKQLAQITSASLSMGQKATFHITFKLDSGSILKMSGIALDTEGPNGRRIPDIAGCDLIMRLLRLLGVNSLDASKGTILYLIVDKEKVLGLEMLSFYGGQKLVIKDWVSDWSNNTDK